RSRATDECFVGLRMQRVAFAAAHLYDGLCITCHSLNPPGLLRTDAAMRDAGHVFNTFNGDIESAQGADGSVAAKADATDKDIRLRKPVGLLGSLGRFF